uniref:Dynein heavy chain AAA 5 extension domain-containing protein n=1 Tax=Anopheles atroparvus TaxID=41427 RepID=A0AAG5CWK4_ANOAO
MNLSLSREMAGKVLLLHRSLLHARRPVLVTGEPGSGKSTATNLALALLSPPCQVHRVIPNVLRASTHPKTFDRRLLDCIIAACLHPGPSRAIGGKCLILDSVPNGEWIECVARLSAAHDYVGREFLQPTVLDETHTAPLAALEDVKVVVECVGSLETMTPAAVSRFTLLHIGPGDLRWEDAVEGWLQQKEGKLERERVRELTGKHFGGLLSFRRRECQTLVSVTDVTMARMFCHLWDALFASFNIGKVDHFPTVSAEDETLERWSVALVKLFFFCAVWSIGGTLNDEESRGKFDLLLREQHPEAAYPLKANVFQLYVDPTEGAWRSWETKLQEAENRGSGGRAYYR